MKVYTKSGDQGTTSLVGGKRISKSDLRVEAYGTVDELTAQVAYLLDNAVLRRELDDDIKEEQDELLWILDRLMVVSGILASDETMLPKMPKILPEDIAKIEQAIDRITQEIPPITKFTLPCGDPLLSLCHIVRTVARRAERAAIRVSEEYGTDPNVIVFLNRLSDYLYVFGRYIGMKLEVEEVLWEPNK